MKDRRVVRGEADRHNHVAKLRKRGVGENAFDVILLRGDQGREQRGDGSDPGDDQKRVRRGLNDEPDANEHVNACGHHCRGVDERRDWRRTFHRIRQPDMQWKLRGLTDCAAENQKRGDREKRRMTC